MKSKFEIREIDAYIYDDEWAINTTYNYGSMVTGAKDEHKAFANYLKRKHGITFKRNRTRIITEYDDCIYIIDRKTKEPLFVAIPEMV